MSVLILENVLIMRVESPIPPRVHNDGRTHRVMIRFESDVIRGRRRDERIKLRAIHPRVQLHHDGNEILAELDIREAIIDFEPMAPVGAAAFKRLVRAGHLVRF